MTAIVGQTLGKDLVAALGLPTRTVWLELRVAVNEAVSITCEYYPSLDVRTRRELLRALKQYELRERRVRTFIPGMFSRFDVGHEMILPQRSPEKRA